ncbi:MAG: hypothetical protein M3436_07135 [Pseudomonadota bacterium]|nr:hypothetical protein [Pseudomonadota bacterium]
MNVTPLSLITANQRKVRMRPIELPLPSVHGLRIVESGYITETLAIYKSEYLALREAAWDGRQITGAFEASPYPFTRPGHIDYVTAAMATLYLSQLSYVAARLLIEEGAFPARQKLSMAYFFETRDAGDQVITRLDARFRQKIPVSGALVEVHESLDALSLSRSHVFVQFRFKFAQCAFRGDIVVAMPLPEPVRE